MELIQGNMKKKIEKQIRKIFKYRFKKRKSFEIPKRIPKQKHFMADRVNIKEMKDEEEN